MKNRLAAVGLAAGLVGGLAGGLVFSPGVAIGQSSTPSQSTESAAEEKVRRAPGQHLADTLAPLVANGTISQAQADKVIAALQAARPEKGPGRHRGQLKFHVALDKVATTLGMTEAALRTALQSGQSIAEIAASKSVPVQTVINALAADARTRLAAKVTANEITQAQADERLANLTKKITEIVNSDPPKFVGRKGRSVRPGSTQSSSTDGAA